MMNFKDYLKEVEEVDKGGTGKSHQIGDGKIKPLVKGKDYKKVKASTKNDFPKNLDKKSSSIDEKKMIVCDDCGNKMTNGKCPKCDKCEVEETADFDHKKPELHDFGNNYDAMSLQGRGNIKQRKRTTSARYGDNPLDDEQELNEEDHQTMLDQLHNILNDAGIENIEIQHGVTLSPEGKQKIAARLGTSASEMDTLLSSLQASMNADKNNRMIQEMPDNQDSRFTFEPDALGNIMIRDTKTGQDKFLQGSEAMDLANQLEKRAMQRGRVNDINTEQQILQQAFMKESSIYDSFFLNEKRSFDDDFDDEINTDSGTYNMPWKLGDSSGTMTVFFTDEDGKPDLKIQSVRDEDGEEIHGMDDDLLLKQARDFLGQE